MNGLEIGCAMFFVANLIIQILCYADETQFISIIHILITEPSECLNKSLDFIIINQGIQYHE